MKLALLGGHYPYNIQHLIRLFIPNPQFIFSLQEGVPSIVTENSPTGLVTVSVSFPHLTKSLSMQGGKFSEKEKQRALSQLLFRLLSEVFDYKPAWGMLIGVRPVSIYFRLKEEGLSDSAILDCFIQDYFLDPQKGRLTVETGQVQGKIRQLISPNGCSLYVSIPFCPTRCRYCSFVSHKIKNTQKLVPEYLQLLKKEISATSTLISSLGLRLQSIYIGGGTPTILSLEQQKDLLKHISKTLPTQGLLEYTLEAGRPDTVDIEKLQLARDFGVDRVSINPQTLNPLVLKSIGRDHSIMDFYKAYNLAKRVGFKAINTDFIAGLPKEEADSFLAGIKEVLTLKPENITIHTLTLKRSSDLNQEEDRVDTEIDLPKTLEEAYKLINQQEYAPYYLYRQKNTLQHQENVGFSLSSKESYYNVAMMEDLQTVFGVGAGASTKIVTEENKKIRRIYNHKYPYEYHSDFESLLERKRKIRGEL